MISKRERLARVLQRAGVSDLVLRVRRRTRAPLLSVLTYHSVDSLPADYLFDRGVVDASPDQFAEQLALLDRHFSVISIDQLLATVRGEASLPPNPVLITFDDGYKSNRYVAAPILARMSMPAVFFVATHYVEHRRLYWWDRISYAVHRCAAPRIALAYPEAIELDLADREAAIGSLLGLVKQRFGLDIDRFLAELHAAAGVPWSEQRERALADELIMTWDELRELQRMGMSVQSHTRRHRVLQTLDSCALAEELAGSRRDLEAELGTPVTTVSYPVGRTIAHTPQIREAVQAAGYELGFSNGSGVNYNWRRLDPYDVRRFSVDRDASPAMFRGQLAIPPLAYSISG